MHLWARDAALVAEIQARRANAVYLPGVALPNDVSVTNSLADAVSGRDLVVSAIPSHGCRAGHPVRRAAPRVGRR